MNYKNGAGGSTFVVNPPHIGFEPFPPELQSGAVFKALLYEAAEKRPRGGTRLLVLSLSSTMTLQR